MKQAKTDDRALVEAALQGDSSAFGELVSRYQRPLYNAALRITNHREDAVEATQSAFVKAYDNLAGYKPEFRFFSWIFRIAVNEALDIVKSRRRFVDEEPDADLLAGVGDPESDCSAAEAERSVRRGMTELSVEYRTVLALRHLQGMSYREISDVVGVPEKTVKSRLFSARQELKKVLLDRGIQP